MYKAMFNFVQNIFEENKGKHASLAPFPFRNRFQHIQRVFLWAERIMLELEDVDKKAVLTAAVFHDVGLAKGDKSKHPEEGAEICREYLKENSFEPDFISFVAYLVRNHSNKGLLADPNTPLELIVLMEADLLDETGALGIVWDCMAAASLENPNYNGAYEQIGKFSIRDMKTNPLVTPKARAYWEEKQQLTQEFARHLTFDLGVK